MTVTFSTGHHKYPNPRKKTESGLRQRLQRSSSTDLGTIENPLLWGASLSACQGSIPDASACKPTTKAKLSHQVDSVHTIQHYFTFGFSAHPWPGIFSTPYCWAAYSNRPKTPRSGARAWRALESPECGSASSGLRSSGASSRS